MAIALMIGSCQPEPIDRGAEAVAWYEEFQQGGGQAAACIPSETPDPPAIAGNFELKSTQVQRWEGAGESVAFAYTNILTNGDIDIYVYGWKTEEFAEHERGLYEMIGHEPLSPDEMSQLDRCFIFTPESFL